MKAIAPIRQNRTYWRHWHHLPGFGALRTFAGAIVGPRPSAQASFRRARSHLDAPRPRRPVCYSRCMSVPPAVSPFVPGRGGLPQCDTDGPSAEVRHRDSAARRIERRRPAISGGAGQRRLCLSLTGSRQPSGARHSQPDALHRSHGTAWWSNPVIGARTVEAEFSLPVTGGKLPMRSG